MVHEIKSSFLQTNAPPLENYLKLTKEKIVNLNRRMIKEVNALERAETQRALTLNKALFLEDITYSSSPSEWRTKSSYSPPKIGLCEPLVSSIRKFSIFLV